MGSDGAPAESQELFDRAACGLLQTDAHGLILRVNTLFCSWVGSDADELIGRQKIQDLFTIGGRIFHQTHWLPLLQLKQSVSEVKFDLRQKDGSTVPIVLNGLRRVQDGIIVHDLAMFIARDRDMYERELLTSGKRLAELAADSARHETLAKDRALFAEQMLGIVSHDLRNPLSVVRLSTQLLQTPGISADQQQKSIERIVRATTRANRMINELLDFTQARIGVGIAIQRMPRNLHTVITDTLHELREAFPGRDLQYASADQGLCDVDADRLEQLLGNLVANAIAYGAQGQPVTVNSELSPELCMITVHNRGTPIPADRVGQVLFQPMTRGQHDADGKRSVGLGLYIVSEIAKAHGGQVSVTSSAEDGTTFTVQFPRYA